MSKRTLLHIDSSARLERSHSRRLGKVFIEAWRAAAPEDEVIYRDIGLNPPPAMSQDWIAAAFTRPENRTPSMRETLSYSDALTL